MKEAKNELLQFVGGVIMLVVGLYILSQKVMVSSSYGFFSLWGGRFSSGLIMVPLIIGVVWMFASGGSFVSKVFTVLSVILIIAAIVASTRIWLVTITMYEWVLILAAVALPVLSGPENLLAEQTVPLGLEGAVVDGLGLFDLAVRPFTDHLRRSDSDFNGVKRCVTHFLYAPPFLSLPDRRRQSRR